MILFNVDIPVYLGIYHSILIYVLSGMLFFCFVLQYVFRWRDYLLPYRLNKLKTNEVLVHEDEPKMSVVITTNDQSEDLSEMLPLILSQLYSNFEVIVVDEAALEETKNYVEYLSLRHKNLRYTFVPKTATDICRKKLAITLGIRAAWSPWVLITNASVRPQSKLWIREMASKIDTQADVIIGYANYIFDGQKSTLPVIYDRLMIQLRCYRSTLSLGCIGAGESNFCLRKSAFMNNKGYANSLNVSFGESHLLVDDLSTRHNVRIACSPESVIREQLPLPEIVKNSQIYYREILHHSSSRAKYYLLREGFASLLKYLTFLLILSYLLLRLYQVISVSQFSVTLCILDALVLTLLFFSIFIPIRCLRLTSEALGDPFSSLSFFVYELKRPLRNAKFKYLRWKYRRDFRKQ